MSLPKYNKILELPDNLSARQLLLNDLIQLASKLVSTGFSNAPVQTQSTLHVRYHKLISYIFFDMVSKFLENSRNMLITIMIFNLKINIMLDCY